ncbi:MAG: hypothetical protein Fur0022_44420 [Anaerolineales bacterium]
MVTLARTEIDTPRRIKMTYKEYLDLTPDSKKVEWVKGEGIVYMPPLINHQRISFFLSKLLGFFVDYFKSGELVVAPFEVKLWPSGPSREPDIFFVSTNNLYNLNEKRFEGGPDLVIELLSAGSLKIDRVDKFSEYEKAGVLEYWLIDPRPFQQQADFYVMTPDGLHPAEVDKKGRYHSTVLPGFWLDLSWLWQEELPNPQWAFAEIMLTQENLPAETKETFAALQKLLSK